MAYLKPEGDEVSSAPESSGPGGLPGQAAANPDKEPNEGAENHQRLHLFRGLLSRTVASGYCLSVGRKKWPYLEGNPH